MLPSKKASPWYVMVDFSSSPEKLKESGLAKGIWMDSKWKRVSKSWRDGRVLELQRVMLGTLSRKHS